VPGFCVKRNYDWKCICETVRARPPKPGFGPSRQLVFTIPRRLRKFFLFDRSLYGKLCRAAYGATRDFLRERLPGGFPTRKRAVPAMVVVPQSFGDLLVAHPHVSSSGRTQAKVEFECVLSNAGIFDVPAAARGKTEKRIAVKHLMVSSSLALVPSPSF